jgi:hypothetical protein
MDYFFTPENYRGWAHEVNEFFYYLIAQVGISIPENQKFTLSKVPPEWLHSLRKSRCLSIYFSVNEDQFGDHLNLKQHENE